MSIEAMKLALEALEWFTAAEQGDEPPINQAITALRQAIEQAQKQEPDVSNKLHFDCEFVDGTCADLTVYGSERDIKRLEARIKFWWNLEQAQKQIQPSAYSNTHQQEPVAWRFKTGTWWNREVHWRYLHSLDGTEGLLGLQPLYTSPPQRQPLTDEEIDELWKSTASYYNTHDFARAIEAAHGIKGEA